MRDQQDWLINRDLSWLKFNGRVLEEAKDLSVLLLERVKFLAIFSSNLDEFFMVRVAGLKRQASGNRASDTDGVAPDGILRAISRRVHELTEEQHLCFLDTVLPQLSAEGIHLVGLEEMTAEQEQYLEDFFQRTLYPIVTPLAIDPGHPFPYLTNRSLSLVVSLRATETMFHIENGQHSHVSHSEDPEEEIGAILKVLKKQLSKCSPKDLTVRLDGQNLTGDYFLLEAF